MRKTNLGGPFLDVNLFLGLGSPWSSDMCVFGLGFALALGNVLAPKPSRKTTMVARRNEGGTRLRGGREE